MHQSRQGQHGCWSMRPLETLFLQSGNTADRKWGKVVIIQGFLPVNHFLQQTLPLLTGLYNPPKQRHHLETKWTNTWAYGGHFTLKPPYGTLLNCPLSQVCYLWIYSSISWSQANVFKGTSGWVQTLLLFKAEQYCTAWRDHLHHLLMDT